MKRGLLLLPPLLLSACAGMDEPTVSARAPINRISTPMHGYVTDHRRHAVADLARYPYITCREAMIRKSGRLYSVDIATLLSDFDNKWILEYGDSASIPEHVFPCLNENEAGRFFEFIDKYMKINKGEIEKPLDWQAKLDKLPTHNKKIEPNK